MVTACNVGSAAPPRGPGYCARGLPLSLTHQRAQISLSLFLSLSFFSSFLPSPCLSLRPSNDSAASLPLPARRGGGASISPTRMLRL